MTRKAPRGAVSIYIKALVLLAWFAMSYVALVFLAATWWQALLLSMSLGLSMAAIGFCVMHDGGHNAFSGNRWLNRLAARSLDMLGGSSYTWHHKHNTIHHTYANIADHDDDIDLGWLGRLAPAQRRLWFHRVQHVYLWILYGFLPVKWQMWDDYYDVARGRVGSHRFARPRGANLAIFIGGKAVFLSLAFLIPMLVHSFWEVVLFYAIACWIDGVVISVVFQLAHAVEPAQFPLPDQHTGRIETPWAEHQVQTTVNFARNNPVLTWFLGGLNYQIEHHLFPRISHVHYPRISRLVERACHQYRLPYNQHPSVFAAIASHSRWLREMGRPIAVGGGTAGVAGSM
jgi:linoleoyl-CoA desaturase